MKHIDTFEQRMLNENYNNGDSVKLKYDIEQDDTDGEYGYSIESGEIGEIRYLVRNDERDENKIYMVKFSDKDGKKRYIQLTQQSFTKVKK